MLTDFKTSYYMILVKFSIQRCGIVAQWSRISGLKIEIRPFSRPHMVKGFFLPSLFSVTTDVLAPLSSILKIEEKEFYKKTPQYSLKIVNC